MPNRIIKESICRSDSINELSWFEEVLFYRLIVNCDDYGRFDGRAAVIKNILFPLKDNITTAAIEKAIVKLVSVELVALYVFEGKPYLHLPAWGLHQNVRAKRSKYPAPDVNSDTDDGACTHLHTDVCKCTHMSPISLSESLSESESLSISESELAREFERLWVKYPRRSGKSTALAAFTEAVQEGTQISAIAAGLDAYLRQIEVLETDPRYIKTGARWFSDRCWLDDYRTEPARKKPSNPFLKMLEEEEEQ